MSLYQDCPSTCKYFTEILNQIVLQKEKKTKKKGANDFRRGEPILPYSQW